ncbi:MAG: 30S ribosomal protein S12 methylthiotransferase RimO [Peptococcaceae bacterium]|nr:30S ribosomal protein S12 methylthiotransferase RimO [Peptococcaceae bacterium]
MKKKICFITLGCAKNTVYSEYMMGLVADSRYSLVQDPAEANVIVVNTCGFITAAKEETINTILELNDLKNNGQCEYLVAIGCMVQKYASEMEEALPELDLLLGSTAYDTILAHIDALYDKEKKELEKSSVDTLWHLPNAVERNGRVLSTPGYYAYLTIAEGCDNRCTFCAIPEMQGPYRSRTMEDILKEANMLASRGVKEVIVIAQDITTYGIDNYGRFALPELLHALCEISDLEWIRLLYAYPNHLSDELIDVIAQEEKICKYIDMPLQHADDDILKAMNRKINQEQIRNLISKMRERIPGLMIRSTFIVGFPGETEAAYRNLLNFLEEMKLDRVGVFPYSQEENTPAGRMPDQLDENLKEERAQNLMDVQFDIMFDKHRKLIGESRRVVIDDIEDGMLLCRSYSEAPDIDPYIIIPIQEISGYEIGQMLDVIISDVHEYDLIGSLAE